MWYRRLRPLGCFDDNVRELRAFHRYARKQDQIWDHFPRCYGAESTDHGSGIVTDLIRDGDGAISRTLRCYLKEHGKTEALIAGLRDFYRVLRVHRLITRDILDHNLVVRTVNERVAVYMIDGIGSSEFVPVVDWFRVLSLAKIERKIKRFKDRYGLGEVHDSDSEESAS